VAKLNISDAKFSCFERTAVQHTELNNSLREKIGYATSTELRIDELPEITDANLFGSVDA